MLDDDQLSDYVVDVAGESLDDDVAIRKIRAAVPEDRRKRLMAVHRILEPRANATRPADLFSRGLGLVALILAADFSSDSEL